MTAIAHALNAALLDFVWQGLLTAFLLWAALFVLKNRSPRARYAASCAALALMAALPVVTACLVYSVPAATGQTPSARVSLEPPAAIRHSTAGSLAWGNSLADWALPIWSCGVLLFALRLVWASRQISALRRQAKPAEGPVGAMVADLQRRMKLAPPVRVTISAVADCPSVVGWIKPVVLLPAATIAGLTPQQLEAVLAHELAHILRYDYVVNMLQTVVETLLFYHPAVWWASARIRQERELCCDDLAVDSCGDALAYARALTRLERLRTATPRLALSGAGGPLLYRIQRLAGEAGWQRGPSKLPGILALSLGLICFAVNIEWARGQQQAEPLEEPGVRVDLQGARVIHRDAVEYPEAAIAKGIQGAVVVEATLDADGVVGDARVLSGPPELRKAALQSVLEWHFTRDAAGSTRQVSIVFRMPETAGAPSGGIGPGVSSGVGGGISSGVSGGIGSGIGTGLQNEYRKQAEKQAADFQAQAEALAEVKQEQDTVQVLAAKRLAEQMAQQAGDLESRLQARTKMAESQLQALLAQRALQESAYAESQASQISALEKRLAELRVRSDFQGAAMLAGRRVKRIEVQRLATAARDELLAKLPVHEGDTLAEDSMEKLAAAARQFDEHLSWSVFAASDGQVEIRIAPSGSGDRLAPPQ